MRPIVLFARRRRSLTRFRLGFEKATLITLAKECSRKEYISCKFSLWFRSVGGMLPALGVELPDLFLLLFTIMNRHIWLALVYIVATHFATLGAVHMIPLTGTSCLPRRIFPPCVHMEYFVPLAEMKLQCSSIISVCKTSAFQPSNTNI
jgi:hypothetical protein